MVPFRYRGTKTEGVLGAGLAAPQLMAADKLLVGWLVKGVGAWWRPASAASPQVWWMASGCP